MPRSNFHGLTDAAKEIKQRIEQVFGDHTANRIPSSNTKDPDAAARQVALALGLELADYNSVEEQVQVARPKILGFERTGIVSRWNCVHKERHGKACIYERPRKKRWWARAKPRTNMSTISARRQKGRISPRGLYNICRLRNSAFRAGKSVQSVRDWPNSRSSIRGRRIRSIEQTSSYGVGAVPWPLRSRCLLLSGVLPAH